MAEAMRELTCDARLDRRNDCKASFSLGGEAVKQPGSAGAFQGILAAPARAVRGIPRLHVPRLLEPSAIMVADDRRALPVLRPVAACRVTARCRIQALRVGAGE